MPRRPARRATARTQVLVAGCGPAGLLAASACAEVGLDVVAVDPAMEAPWPNRYGVWVDELDGLDLNGALAARWDTAIVELGEGRRHELPRAYAQVDGDGLKRELLRRLERGGGATIRASVERVEPGRDGATVRLGDGTAVDARVVVDATGPSARLLRRGGPPASAYQTAYGVLADIDGAPIDPEAMTLMDWRDPGPEAPALPGGTPSFLYAMPLDGGRAFLEETVLVQRPAVPVDLLRARLEARLARHGASIRRVHDVERCRIGMDGPVPDLGQRVVGFGASAGFVHPATGYQLTHAARLAPALATTLARHLGGRRPDVAAAARDAWRTLWPRDAVRRHMFHLVGGDLLARLDGPQVRSFFDAFFRTPEATWRGYLSRDLSMPRLAAAMLRLLPGLTPALRARLAAEVLRDPARLLRGVAGSAGSGRLPRPRIPSRRRASLSS